jgi:flagellin
MGLKINTNVAGLKTTRILRNSTLQLNKSLERLSSGLRVNRAADDAAGLAIAEGFRSVHRGAVVAQRNAQDGISLVQTAEGALSETINMLQRIRELAVQSANGTNSPQNRIDLNLEVQQLFQQIDTVAQDTEFNGVKLLDGVAGSVVLQVGPSASTVLSITFATAMSVLGLGLDPLRAAGVLTEQDSRDILQPLTNALNLVNNQRSTLGAAQNRLEFTINSLQIQEENAVSSESAIRDADIGRETITFTRNQILVSAGTSILAQANVIPQTALQLLGG